LYEIRVIDIAAFMSWKQDKQAKTMNNYPVIIAATKSFYDALSTEEKEGNQTEESKPVESTPEAQS